MSREEEIQRAERNYLVNTPTSDWFSASGKSFRSGVLWADQHPRKGFWNSEKVIKFIKENVREYHKSGVFHIDDFVKDLTKAMEVEL